MSASLQIQSQPEIQVANERPAKKIELNTGTIEMPAGESKSRRHVDNQSKKQAKDQDSSRTHKDETVYFLAEVSRVSWPVPEKV